MLNNNLIAIGLSAVGFFTCTSLTLAQEGSTQDDLSQLSIDEISRRLDNPLTSLEGTTLNPPQ